MKVKFLVPFVQLVSRGGKETKNFNTSNMRHHLEAKHLAKYEQPKAKEKELA